MAHNVIIRPRLQRQWVLYAATAVLLAHIIAAIVLTIGYSGIQFRFSDRIAIIGIGLILTATILCGLRPRIMMNNEGVVVRNLGADTLYHWDDIRGFTFEKYWAYLLLAREERVILLAIPITDGEQAVKHLNILRTGFSEYNKGRTPSHENR